MILLFSFRSRGEEGREQETRVRLNWYPKGTQDPFNQSDFVRELKKKKGEIGKGFFTPVCRPSALAAQKGGDCDREGWEWARPAIRSARGFVSPVRRPETPASAHSRDSIH